MGIGVVAPFLALLACTVGFNVLPRNQTDQLFGLLICFTPWLVFAIPYFGIPFYNTVAAYSKSAGRNLSLLYLAIAGSVLGLLFGLDFFGIPVQALPLGAVCFLLGVVGLAKLGSNMFGGYEGAAVMGTRALRDQNLARALEFFKWRPMWGAMRLTLLDKWHSA